MSFANPRRHRAVIETTSYTTYCYYNTPVLKVSKCRSHVILNTGGKATRGTANAMNDALQAERIPVGTKVVSFNIRACRTSSALRTFTAGWVLDSLTIKLI